MDWIIILIVAPFLIGMVGEVIKKLTGAKAGNKGWRGVYFVTYKVHAIVAGVLVGLAMYAGHGPVPEVFHSVIEDESRAGISGYMLAYAFSGGVAMVAYATIVGTIKNAIKHVRIGNGGDG